LVKESDYASFSNDLVEVSQIHSNFLINKSGSALDIEMLLERIRANVFYKTGLWLEREIEVVGY
jgi:UDP-N-acetylenolpyruvoylglucosamine reductase